MKSTLAHWSVSLIFWTHCIPKLSGPLRIDTDDELTTDNRVFVTLIKIDGSFCATFERFEKNRNGKSLGRNYSPDRPVRLHKRFELSASFGSKRLSRKWKSFQVSLTQLARVYFQVLSGCLNSPHSREIAGIGGKNRTYFNVVLRFWHSRYNM